jgi:signal recognition particle GTPase
MTEEEIRKVAEELRREIRNDLTDIFVQQDENQRELIDTLNMLAQLVAEGQQRERQQTGNLWSVFQSLSEEVASLRQLVDHNQKTQEDALDHVSDQLVTTDIGVMLTGMDIGTVLARLGRIELILALLLPLRVVAIAN